MRRRITSFKADVLNFLTYIIPIFSSEFLYTFITESLAKYSHPAAISQDLRLYLQNNF
jgi:hypothetical protein